MHPRPTTSADPARELLDDFPEYATTQILDHLRSTEYARLDIGGQAYLDYTGGGMYADSQIREVAERAGLDPQKFLAINDAYTFFERCGGLLKTGPTHTNVMDLRVVLVGQEP